MCGAPHLAHQEEPASKSARRSCEAAYLISTLRGQEALWKHPDQHGQGRAGQLVVRKPRERREPIRECHERHGDFLFDEKSGGPGETLMVSAIGAPALGWPDVTVDLCPGRPQLSYCAGFIGKTHRPSVIGGPIFMLAISAGLAAGHHAAFLVDGGGFGP
jgi:hypothetical protein